MPIAAAVLPAVIGGAVSIYGASKASKAAGKANAAQQAAADRQLADQKAARDRIDQLQQPFVQGGYGALDQIMAKYGINQPAPAARPSSYQPGVGVTAARVGGQPVRSDGGFAGTSPMEPAAPSAGEGPDWGAYLNNNPDVAAEYERLASTPEGQATLAANGGGSPEQYAARHYATSGQAEGRQITGMQPQATQGPTAPGEPQRPTFSTPQYTRPDQPQWEGAGADPNAADYLDPSKFQTDPGYQFRLNEGNRNLNASYGARGLLKSGGAIKGFTDYNQGVASQEYGNWFNRQMQRLQNDRAQYNQNRSANFNIFDTNRQKTNANFDADRQVGLTQFNNDRSFTANRDDTRTNNLFRLTGIGTNAAGATGQAATGYADNAAQIYGNQADSAGSAALAKGYAWNNAIQDVGGAAANIFNRYAPKAPATAAPTGNWARGGW